MQQAQSLLQEALAQKQALAKPVCDFLDNWQALEPSSSLVLQNTDLKGITPACAWILNQLSQGKSSPAICWLVVPHLRAQELLSEQLPAWGQTPLFFPREQERLEANTLPDPEEQAERLAVLQAIAQAQTQAQTQSVEKPQKPLLVLIEEGSLEEFVPQVSELSHHSLELKIGQELELEEFQAKLEDAGYQRAPQVSQRGEYALRGGIVDVFSWAAAQPLRLEFFDTELESLREFDLHSQTTTQRLQEAKLLLQASSEEGEKSSQAQPSSARSSTSSQRLGDWMQGQNQLTLALHCPKLVAQIHLLDTGQRLENQGNIQHKNKLESTLFESLPDPLGQFEAGDFLLQTSRQEQIIQQLARWKKQGWQVILFSQTKGEEERLLELEESLKLGLSELPRFIGQIQYGASLAQLQFVFLSAAELFGRYQGRRARRSQHSAQGSKDHFTTRRVHAKAELSEGEFVVHTDYGVARYRGIEKTQEGEFLILEYAAKAKLKVPLTQSHLVARYVGMGKTQPELSKLGEAGWRRTKAKAQEAVMDYAAHLLELQAKRQTLAGFSHEPDKRWQQEFENSFPYRETPDQLRSIAQVKQDMESTQPMDRLLCGDVGFGKTEVALRAAFKAVMSGTQVALLCPTTVLAQQHWKTFRERLSDYPMRVDLLNRFRSRKEQKASLEALKSGEVDILIGTHRLLSADVQWQNLGLAIVDEEQRFGVRHKERFKELFHLVDQLTLSATPIPRTLYQGLVGVRDLSTLETPPLHRHSVQTQVSLWDDQLVARAIERELQRQGQVFFLHNRVGTIEQTAAKLKALSPPNTRLLIGHGQMEQNQLEEVMQQFLEGEADILVCTTIIETGIDIPNANTIFIDRADRFGLADLYQLRGRVGRAHHQGYAYLLLPGELINTEAKKRVSAIRQYSQLGDGLRIAMRDLEIRGAGNLLGTKQSGHIAQVGFELYCQLLRQSIDQLQGRRSAHHQQVTFRADCLMLAEPSLSPEAAQESNNRTSRNSEENREQAIERFSFACLPASWITEAIVRLRCYRELAEVATQKDLKLLKQSWQDRFGAFPPEVELLLLATEVKLRAARAGIELVELEEQKLKLRRQGEFIQPHGKFPRMKGKSPLHKLRSANELLQKM